MKNKGEFMFKYFSEIDLDNIKIEKLNYDNLNLTNGFSCGNLEFDFFLQGNAIEEHRVSTYLILYNNDLLGFFSLSANGIYIEDNDNSEISYISSAIEISYFALEKKYHHVSYNEEEEKKGTKFYLSDVLISKILEFISNYIIDIVGAQFIILYSVPEAESLYSRNEFKSFENYMKKSNKPYLRECIPMYIKSR